MKLKPAPFSIVFSPVDSVAPHPYNPRQISSLQFDRLVKSLAECPDLFLARPVLVSVRADGSRIIIGGDKRWRAAKQLDYKEIPTILFSGLSEKQEREIIIKDNGEFGEWDWDLLANNFDGLPLDDWGIALPEDWLRPADAGGDKLADAEIEGKLSDAIGNYIVVNFEDHAAYVEFLSRLGLKDGSRSVAFEKLEVLLVR